MNDQEMGDQEWLLEKGTVVEQPFVSNTPIFGPLIAWFRTQWNNVAAKWYVRPMLSQQNEYNRLLVERVRDFETYTYELSSEQDHDLSRLRHDVAALHLQLKQLNRQLDELNDRLQENESSEQQDGKNG